MGQQNVQAEEVYSINPFLISNKVVVDLSPYVLCNKKENASYAYAYLLWRDVFYVGHFKRGDLCEFWKSEYTGSGRGLGRRENLKK